MQTEVRNEGGCWSVFVDGQRMVDRESFTVADRVKWYLDNPQRWDHSESCDVADSIRRWAEGAMNEGAVKPRCQLVGTDGNVFAIIGTVAKTLRRAGQHEREAEWRTKAMACESYDAVLGLVFEFVDPI